MTTASIPLASLFGGNPAPSGPTPRDVVHHEGTTKLYRFRPQRGLARATSTPLLLVPSLINRWYVLDLREGASMAAALVGSGIDTYCLDWGAPEDEDRYLDWDTVLAKLARAVRRVGRAAGAEKVGVLGYCVGGTLAGIHAALHPDSVAALVNLAGPFDFSHSGFLGAMVDARWFDPAAIAAAGNVGASQMQAGFSALRPTLSISKWVNLADRGFDQKTLASFESLEGWASDNIPFPGAAYATYVRELYQENRLVKGEHFVGGKRVDLGAITCPVMTIVAERDAICPPDAATALNDGCASEDKTVLRVPGGHVGAVVGGRASRELYPALAKWFVSRVE